MTEKDRETETDDAHYDVCINASGWTYLLVSPRMFLTKPGETLTCPLKWVNLSSESQMSKFYTTESKQVLFILM